MLKWKTGSASERSINKQTTVLKGSSVLSPDGFKMTKGPVASVRVPERLTKAAPVTKRECGSVPGLEYRSRRRVGGALADVDRRRIPLLLRLLRVSSAAGGAAKLGRYLT